MNSRLLRSAYMPSPYSNSADIWLPVFTVFLLIALSAYSWRGRSVPGALPFAIASLFTALWVVGSVMEYAAMDLAVKITWVKFQAIWQLLASTLITCFILEFSSPRRWLTRRSLILLFIVPALNIVAILIDQYYPLPGLGFGFDGSVLPLSDQRSWFFLAYIYGLGLVNLIVFVWLFVHSPRQRWPVIVMTTGQSTAGMIFLLDATGISHSMFPVEMFGIAILFFAYAVVLFGLYMLNPIPLAHQMALKQMHTGMLVLDSHKDVVSLNSSAERILKLSTGRAIGLPIWEVLPDYPDESLVDTTSTEIELSLETDQGVRHYTLTISLLKDLWGFDSGRLLLLRDVTEQKQAQAKLFEQKQALAILQERERLARDLHDTLGQVLGYASMQIDAAAKLSGEGQGAAAASQLDRLGGMIREAHAEVREYIMNLRTTPALHRPFFTAVQQYLEGFTSNYDIQADLTIGSSWNGTTFSPDVQLQIFRIVQEALSNARKHSKAHHVQVKFEAEDGRVFVIIRDDGYGFSPDNHETVYGQHFGLQFMQERAGQLGGTLQIQSTPGKGTEVVLEVPGKVHEYARSSGG
jgi:signal transduction histidine kinase